MIRIYRSGSMLTSRSFENGEPALLRNYGKSPLLRKTLLRKSSLLKSLLRKPRLADIEKTDRSDGARDQHHAATDKDNHSLHFVHNDPLLNMDLKTYFILAHGMHNKLCFPTTPPYNTERRRTETSLIATTRPTGTIIAANIRLTISSAPQHHHQPISLPPSPHC